MSIYLEFPAIEDYPVYIPMERITAMIPDWIVNAVQSCLPDLDTAEEEAKLRLEEKARSSKK